MHLPESGDRSQTLVASSIVLDGLDDERQDISYVDSQPRPSHSGKLPRGGQHARNNPALSSA
jgi:hypothetical protein